MKTILLIIGLYHAFTFVSIGQEFPHDDDPSVVGKTFTVEEDDEEITFDFRENGVVFISGSEFGDQIEASFTQDEDDVIIKIGDEEILAFFDGEEFEIEKPEYYPEGYAITSVGVSRESVKQLRAAGGNPKYTEYPGVGHDSWTRAYRDQELLDWLFAQSRK